MIIYFEKHFKNQYNNYTEHINKSGIGHDQYNWTSSEKTKHHSFDLSSQNEPSFSVAKCGDFYLGPKNLSPFR